MPKSNRNRLGNLDLGAQPTPQIEQSSEQSAQPKRRRATVNLTVRPELCQEWREWCVRHQREQRDAFEEAFRLLQERHGR